MRFSKSSLVLGLACAFAFGGCDDSSGPSGNKSQVSVFLTDAPGDVQAAYIDIDHVYLTGDKSGDIDLPTTITGPINVTELVGTVRQLTSNVTLDPDTFGQLRLVLKGAVIVTKGGEVVATSGATLPSGVSSTNVKDLQCPSCAQSGLKVVLGGADRTLSGGETGSVIIDFDVSQSFGKEAGNSGKWVMKPTIHATLVPAPTQTSAISGTVTIAQTNGQPSFTIPQCPSGTARSITDFVPTATASTLKDVNNAAIVRTGTTAANGTFSISAVSPDSYAMGFSPLLLGPSKIVWTGTVTPTTVTIASGQSVTNVAYVLTGASCQANP
jgi:hypothetical protein